MMGLNHLICIDDDDRYIKILRKIALDVGYSVAGVCNIDQFRDHYRLCPPSVVVTDVFLGPAGFWWTPDVLDFLERERSRAGIVLVSGFDWRVLGNATAYARDRGLLVLGQVEKGRNLEKLSSLLSSAFVGSLRNGGVCRSA